MKSALLVFPAAALLVLASCATTSSTPQFSPWLGPAEVRTGGGGSMTRVDGMDVWQQGSPSRKIKLLGYISESSQPGAPVSPIVAEARRQGGDTIVHIKPKNGVSSWAVYKYQ